MSIPADKSAGDELTAAEVNLLRDLGFIVDQDAGEPINGGTLPVAVYWDNTDDEWKACDGNDSGAIDFAGFAISNSTDGNPINVQTVGRVTGFSGLTVGAKYYVQDDKTIGTSVGTISIFVGIAVSATDIQIQGKGNYVDLLGAQTIAGVKTFSSIPVGPASDPSTGNQLTRKDYVDVVASKKISIVIADVTITNTATETNLISVSIPADTLGTSNGVRVRLFIVEFDSVTSTTTLRFKYGGTTLVTLVMSTAPAIANLSGYIDILLLSGGSTGSQEGSASVSLIEGKFGTDNEILWDSGVGTSSEDSTGALNLVVTWQKNGSDGGDKIVMSHATVEAIK